MKKVMAVFIVVLTVLSSGAFLGTLGWSAGTYDIKEMTPAVKQALENRRSRFEDLRRFKSQGVIGENKSGYVEVLSSNTEAQSLTDAENKDRAFIYKTIVEQNNLPADALSTVETVFAQVQRDKASAGEKIQQSNGEWTTK